MGIPYRKVLEDMSYKIIVDSSCELPAELMEDPHFCTIPFGLEVGGVDFVDDDHLDVKELLDAIAACPTCPKSSCPSPQLFLEKIEDNSVLNADRVYIITISEHLSGCYNSAVLAKNMYEENHQDKQIAVIDSLSASCGETQVAMLAHELEQEGGLFEDNVAKLENFRDNMETTFVLDNIETLRKNGRLSRVKALVATSLNIKPVLGADKGTIVQISQGIGMKKALNKLVDVIVKNGGELSKKRIIITHCNNLMRAEEVKKLLQAKVHAPNILVMATRGLSSLYANDGGIIVTY